MISEVILSLTDNDGNQAVLDLYENEKLYYNFHFQDLTDFGSVSSYSREFRVPASENNLAFFGAIFNVNLDGWFDFRKKVSATLTSSTIPIASGYIQVKNILWSNGQAYEFNIVFFGEVANLAKSIGDKKLKDIGVIANGDLDYTNTYANVPSTNANMILTLCDKYNLYLTDNSNYHLPVLNPDTPLKVGHLTPSVSAFYLFSQILSDAGIAFTSDNLEEVMNNIYIPFVNSAYLNSSQGLNDNASYLSTTSDLTGITCINSASNTYNFYSHLVEQEDAGNNWSGGIFTAPNAGSYTFNTFLNITTNVSGGNSLGINVVYEVNGAVQAMHPYSYGASPIVLNDTCDVTMNAGDTLKVKIIFVTTQATTVTSSILSGSGVTLTNMTSDLIGSTVYMRYNAPDMKQIDFIRSIQQMFNLVFVPDKSQPNVMRIEPMNYYIGSGDTLDWTQKLDISKDVNYMPTTDLQSSNVTFTYSSDGDICNKFFTDNGRVYGNYQITENDFDVTNDFASGELKIELGFAPTPCNAIENSNIIVPKFINESGQFVTPKPRILYNAGNNDVYLYNESTNASVLTSVPVLSHYSVVNANISDNDLNFSPETPLQNIVANPYNNLYNLYWRNYYREIYDGQARIMDAYFKLSLTDIFNSDFSDKIWIIDSWWRILDIEGYTIGEYESTKVKLIRLLDIDNSCNATPTTANLDGSINFSDSTFGTEDCCRRVGYYWNPTTSKCYSKPNQGSFNINKPSKPLNQVSELNGVIRLNGSIATPIKNVTGTHVVQPYEKNIVVSGLSGDTNIYLPSATIVSGQEFVIKNLDDTYKVTINPQGFEKIDNVLTKTLSFTGDSCTLVSDGSNWIVQSEETNQATWTIDCMDALSVSIYAPYPLIIWSKHDVKNSPTVTITLNGSAYSFGTSVAEGDTIGITASTASVFNLIIEEIW